MTTRLPAPYPVAAWPRSSLKKSFRVFISGPPLNHRHVPEGSKAQRALVPLHHVLSLCYSDLSSFAQQIGVIVQGGEEMTFFNRAILRLDPCIGLLGHWRLEPRN